MIRFLKTILTSGAPRTSPVENARMRKFSNWLGKKWEASPPKKRKVAMTITALLTGGYLIGLMIGAIGYDPPDLGHIQRPVLQKAVTGAQMEDTRQHIERFHRIMDSLGKSSSGRKARDSILARHPGIMDTIAELELNMLPLKR
ncbi:ferritin family protein [Pedobacter chitinilyticus]|uniref:Uncharacterized protein n=1 Tax=Pedobacter chitinilyticus TaxID=2233776 RepID=A0A3S3PNY9_9SPHI|nr:hypothetical protein [Pedobacter chitinilyticus]RWU08128.1 hypothetical protein DPV69_07035 [Pedobacter chitinilyticus]